MGMDLSIHSARNHEVFKHDWWNNPEVEEEFYGRKAWHYPDYCRFIPKNYESNDLIELTIENVEEMIDVACKYRNYWGTYDDVPKLCELRDKMMTEEEYDNTDCKPRKYFLHYSY